MNDQLYELPLHYFRCKRKIADYIYLVILFTLFNQAISITSEPHTDERPTLWATPSLFSIMLMEARRKFLLSWSGLYKLIHFFHPSFPMSSTVWKPIAIISSTLCCAATADKVSANLFLYAILSFPLSHPLEIPFVIPWYRKLANYSFIS